MYKNKKFIVVEGPIGVGKTTLAKKLANSLDSEILLENFLDNPFLKLFYNDIERYALPTQLYFLLQRSNDFSKEKTDTINKKNIISDFFINKDKLFAKAILSNKEYNLYLDIYKALKLAIPNPDLVIYLQADCNTLMNRIRKRGNNFENNLTEDYLKNIIAAYTKYFYSYEGSPLLIINTSSVDINKESDYSILLQEIKKESKGKSFFNPSTINL
jgi:deoxyadenosine/deoxycytidine kinase|tara:strand:- start:1911 stop:2555 length:645 start_codon:yes stop_codon:yes gene_type:complete